jgi:hypothetical protein
MKTRYLLAIAAAAMLSASTSQAATWKERVTYQREGVDVFPANQLSLDAFGTYADRDRVGNTMNRLGGGLGLDYFFTRYIGIGADTYIEEWKWPYRVNGDAILRLPLQERWAGIAPYALGGGGREFKDIPQYSWHVGGGMEFKFNPHTGIFADARRVFPDKTPDYTLVRAGLRIGF